MRASLGLISCSLDPYAPAEAVSFQAKQKIHVDYCLRDLTVVELLVKLETAPVPLTSPCSSRPKALGPWGKVRHLFSRVFCPFNGISGTEFIFK